MGLSLSLSLFTFSTIYFFIIYLLSILLHLAGIGSRAEHMHCTGVATNDADVLLMSA